MRKLILGLLACAIVTIPMALSAPAQADLNGNRRCMSKFEWKQITEYHDEEADTMYYFGTSQERVHAIVGN